MTATHSRSPWRWSYHAIPSEPFAIVTADGQKDVLLATETDEGRIIIKCSESDMALIRRAPELLAASRTALAFLDSMPVAGNPGSVAEAYHLEARQALRSAIAKAEDVS
jgi:hypothetical protein